MGLLSVATTGNGLPKSLGIPRYVDQHSELKTIGFTVIVRNGDRHRIGTAAQVSSGD
jgi:hypothetical protein